MTTHLTLDPVLSMAAHELLCVVLWYTVFCRSVHTTERVRLDVRAAFFVLGVVALLAMVAPIAWAWRPDGVSLALLAAVCLVQVVTATHWSHGVPDRFYQSGHAPRRRRASDATPPNQHPATGATSCQN